MHTPLDHFLPVPPNILIISDYNWWIANAEEIEEWMEDNLTDCKRNGMVLEFANDKEYMIFLLKWQ